jgi:hypothetical protein
MSAQFDAFSIFDDKGEVKQLVDFVIQQIDSEVTIKLMRKIDFSYIFTLSKRDRLLELQLNRAEIDASWSWRNGRIDEILQRKVFNAIGEF